MKSAYTNNAVREKHSTALPVRRPSTTLACVATQPLTQLALNADSMRRRMDLLRMSNAERMAAVDALLLGRDIGTALQHLGRVVRRWLGTDTDDRHLRRTAFRNLIRMRRARRKVLHTRM